MALLLGGCMVPALDAGEFQRQMTTYGKAERVDIDRPLRDVGATFRERASACLKTTTTTYSGQGQLRTMEVLHYTPTVVETPGRVELHLQVRREGLTVYDQGPKGIYGFFVHATPLDARRTRLEMWHTLFGNGGEPLRQAVKGWASGTFSGCPDLA
jgi:hypothetical protein